MKHAEQKKVNDIWDKNVSKIFSSYSDNGELTIENKRYLVLPEDVIEKIKDCLIITIEEYLESNKCKEVIQDQNVRKNTNLQKA